MVYSKKFPDQLFVMNQIVLDGVKATNISRYSLQLEHLDQFPSFNITKTFSSIDIDEDVIVANAGGPFRICKVTETEIKMVDEFKVNEQTSKQKILNGEFIFSIDSFTVHNQLQVVSLQTKDTVFKIYLG